jgi:hypothetical protein
MTFRRFLPQAYCARSPRQNSDKCADDRHAGPSDWRPHSQEGLPILAEEGLQVRRAVADAATVPVNRGSLAALLRLAELGLAHDDSPVTADAREALDHIRMVLANPDQRA